MGEFYRARDLKLKREVAIKILPDLSRHPDRVRRFEREAEVLAAQSSEHCRDLRPYKKRMARAFSSLNSSRAKLGGAHQARADSC
jgi:serine/threonine protein kinase